MSGRRSGSCTSAPATSAARPWPSTSCAPGSARGSARTRPLRRRVGRHLGPRRRADGAARAQHARPRTASTAATSAPASWSPSTSPAPTSSSARDPRAPGRGRRARPAGRRRAPSRCASSPGWPRASTPAALPDGDPVERARALVARGCRHARRWCRPPRPADDDLDDPYHAPRDDVRGLRRRSSSRPLARSALACSPAPVDRPDRRALGSGP